MKKWLLLVASIPGAAKTPRMRIWRALRACGAAMLRDGVYLLPHGAAARRAFAAQAAEIEACGGAAWLLPVGGPLGDAADGFEAHFDRGPLYARLTDSLARFERSLNRLREGEARRRLASVRREIAALEAIDFFAGRPREQAEQALARAERAVNAAFAADEPRSVRAPIARADRARHRGRLWATRRGLWIDRVCSAWLIRRFIDPRARFAWLADPRKCPRSAVGFDFDGATFTHVSGRVTFEVLAASFRLDADPSIARIGALVRYLDVGGVAVPEAAGIETIMAGLRARSADDDEILAVMSGVLDELYAAYARGPRGRRSRR